MLGRCLSGTISAVTIAMRRYLCCLAAVFVCACGPGAGGDVTRVSPSSTPPLSRVVDIALGYDAMCALVNDGTVFCWGGGPSPPGNQVFIGGGNSRPTQVAGLDGVTQLALTENHACVVLADTSVSCWGSNRDGQLGNRVCIRDGAFCAEPGKIDGLTGVAEVRVSNKSSCARLLNGTVQCWGAIAAATSPQTIPGLDSVIQLAAGQTDRDFCARLSDGKVRCSDANINDEMGVNTFGLLRASAAAEVAVGGDRACAVSNQGRVSCWVTGPDTSSAEYPRGVPEGLPEAVSVYCGSQTVCAKDASGAIWCWGNADNGFLGVPANKLTFAMRPAPPSLFTYDAVRVPDLGDVTQIALSSSHTCALVHDGTLRCWGAGWLGDNP